MNIDDMDLSPDQRAKARACKTPEELLSQARKEGYELSDDALASVSGGGDWSCGNACNDYDPDPHSR